MTTTDELSRIAEQARAGLAAASDERALEAWRTSVLGRSGSVTSVLRSLGGLEPEARRSMGAAANRLKGELEAALEARREEETVAHGWTCPFEPAVMVLTQWCRCICGSSMRVAHGRAAVHPESVQVVPPVAGGSARGRSFVESGHDDD